MVAPSGRPGPLASSVPNSPEPKLFGFVFFGLLAALVWAPLPLGSNRPWAASFLSLWLFALWGALLLGSLWRPQWALLWLPRLKRAWLPLALLAGFAAVAALQLLPWPPALRAALLPLALPPESIAPGLAALPGPLTLDVAATQRHLLSSLGYLAAFALVVCTVNTPRRAQWLLGGLVAAGVLQALLAVALYAGGGHYQFFFYEFRQGGRASGSFPNPDHLAGHMELCLAAGLGLMMAQFSAQASSQPRHAQAARAWLLTAFDFILSTKMLLRLMLVIMVIALVMTHSRMGNGAFFLAMLLAGGLVAALSPRLRKPALWLVLSMVVVDVFIIGQWVGLERVVARVSGTVATEEARLEAGLDTVRNYREETLEARMEAPKAALGLLEDAPWLGHGAGSFFAAFPPFKTERVYPNYFEHAHNDYAQVGAETGALGLALWLGLGLASALVALLLLRDATPSAARGLGLAATVALLALGLHSLVDFNLQIPANALSFTCLLAGAWAGRQMKGPKASRRSQRSASSSIRSRNTRQFEDV